MRKPFLRSIASYAALALVALAAHAEPICSDFLRDLHKKPAALEYLGCELLRDHQGSPLQASYRVPGGHAEAAERYLRRALKFRKLKRDCCVWESVDNEYPAPKPGFFLITMSSGETLVSRRSGWSAIPFFYVTVDRWRDDP